MMSNVETNQTAAVSAPVEATPAVEASVNTNTQPGASVLTNPMAEQPAVQQSAPQQMPDFLNTLAEELRGQKALATFKTADDLAKSYLHAQQLLGKRIQDLSPEDAAHLNTLRGVPKSADQYTLPTEGSEDMIQWYKQAAVQAGLTQEQAKGIYDQYVMLERTKLDQINQQRTDARVAAEAELRKEFGAGASQQVKLAADAIRNFGGDEVLQAIDETGLGNNPKVIKMLAKIGQQLMEDQVVEADKSSVFGMTPEMAQREINFKMADNEFKRAYYSNLHPNHKAAVADMERLLGLLHK